MFERAGRLLRPQRMWVKRSLVATLMALAITGVGSQGLDRRPRTFIAAIKVVDEKGKPVSRASVLVVPIKTMKEAIRHDGETSRDGLYSSGLHIENIHIYISDGVRVARKTIRSFNDYQREPVVVPLTKSGAVASGYVVDFEGKPIPGASIKCFRRHGLGGTYVGEVLSDKSGKFVFRGLWDSFAYSFEVYAEGFGRTQALASHMVKEGRVSNIGSTKLPIASSFIEGEIIDEWGHLIPEAVVTMVVYPEKSVKTNAAGEFKIVGIPPGKHMVTVFYGSSYVDTTVEAGKTIRIVAPRK